MLNYENDPLLLENQTANFLISKKKDDLLFLDKNKGILNIFSAFVKMNDFVKKDKIVQPLQTTLYAKISKDLADELNKRCNSTKQVRGLISNYTKKRTNCNVDKWFKLKVFPLIFLWIISKDVNELSRWVLEIDYLTDYLNKSRFYVPKKIDDLLDNKLIYFVGCSVGDGHIDKAGKRWILVDGSSDNRRLEQSRDFIYNLASLLKNYIKTYTISEHKTKYVLNVNNKSLCRFLNFFFSLPYGAKKNVTLKVPLILSYSRNNLEKYFWRGMFDTDGSAVQNHSVDLCSSDKNILKECTDFFKKLSINPKVSMIGVRVNNSDLKTFSHVGFAHPRKQIEFLSSLKQGPKFKVSRIIPGMEKKISSDLYKIHEFLRVDNSNNRIRINATEIRRSNITFDDVKEIIKNNFGYEFKITSKNLHYFKSKKVASFLRSRFIYEPAWKAIEEEEEDQLLISWNDVWRKC